MARFSKTRRDIIERNRVRQCPRLVRIVVAIDPAATANQDSDETGIAVAGVDAKHDGYVLDDLTVKASPHGWASQAVAGYSKYLADRIVGEANNGGDMVENTIRTLRDESDRPIGRDIPFTAVHASRGKQTRAEPISALYEQCRVHHVGSFPDMEDQMVSWVPGEKSPDRMDALVWALTELMIDDDDQEQYWRAI
jgi:phage terminase large subunit-like protein